MTDFARGERLLELRTTRRLSREKLAQEIEVTTKSVYEWEKRDGPIKWENAKKLARFYGLSPEELVTRETNAQIAAQTELREQLDRIEQTVDALAGWALRGGGAKRDAVAELERALGEIAQRRRATGNESSENQNGHQQAAGDP